MRVISNKGSDNHLKTIVASFQESDVFFLCSPFLTEDFWTVLEEAGNRFPSKIVLITTFKPNSRDQIRKTESFESLFAIAHEKQLAVEIFINNKLHGKVYLFEKNASIQTGIVTSANFTASGLSKNHEWGLAISDEEILRALKQEILDSYDCVIDGRKLNEVREKIEDFMSKQGSDDLSERIDLDCTGIISAQDRLYPVGQNVWLKPYGDSKDQIPPDREYASPIERISFTRRTPASVKIGDLLLLYAVGSRNLISLFRVLKHPQKATPEQIEAGECEERYPWYADCENLTPRLGKIWSQAALNITTLRSAFLAQCPGCGISATGNQTYNALTLGHD